MTVEPEVCHWCSKLLNPKTQYAHIEEDWSDWGYYCDVVCCNAHLQDIRENAIEESEQRGDELYYHPKVSKVI